jgi:hypothetical protein
MRRVKGGAQEVLVTFAEYKSNSWQAEGLTEKLEEKDLLNWIPGQARDDGRRDWAGCGVTGKRTYY